MPTAPSCANGDGIAPDGTGDRPALVAGVESGDERTEPAPEPEPVVDVDAYEAGDAASDGRLGSASASDADDAGINWGVRQGRAAS